MRAYLCGFIFILLFSCSRPPQNVATFCRDFDANGCIGPAADSITYSLEKSERRKTFRDFWNSIYFRGDRLAFALKNTDARKEVTFECLRGHYTFPVGHEGLGSTAGTRPSLPATVSHDGLGSAAGTKSSAPVDSNTKHELEYIELRDKDVYGLVLLGAMLEKKFPERRNAAYSAPPAFEVTYHVYCGKDPLMQKSIRVELQ